VNPNVAIAVGGALGALFRFWAGSAIQRLAVGSQFPWGTLVVNIAGAFALGFVLTALPNRSLWTAAIGTGFLGAFTTFSTFSYEVVSLFNRGLATTAAFYLATSLIGGIIGVLAGSWAGSHL